VHAFIGLCDPSVSLSLFPTVSELLFNNNQICTHLSNKRLTKPYVQLIKFVSTRDYRKLSDQWMPSNRHLFLQLRIGIDWLSTATFLDAMGAL